MARGADGFIGLAPDAPAYPPEWREACGRAWAIERVRSGQPSDPLLFALVRHHPRLHDGRSVDEAARERIRRVLDQPDEHGPPVAMAETGEAPSAETSAARRARIARAVPAEPVRGWVPPHKRTPAVGANVAAGGNGPCGGSAYLPRRDPQPHGASLLRTLGSQPTIAGASTSTPVEAPASFPSAGIPPQSAPQVLARPPTSDCAPETARSADAPAVIPPAAGAPVAVANAVPARQYAPAASTGGMGGSALRQRPAAAPASTPPCSPAAAVTATSPSAPDRAANAERKSGRDRPLRSEAQSPCHDISHAAELAEPRRHVQSGATAAPGSTTRAGSRGVGRRQRLPAAAAGRTTVSPSASPAAASAPSAPVLDLDFRDADGFRWAIGPGGWARLAGGLPVDSSSSFATGCWPPAASFTTIVPALRSPVTMRRIRDVVRAHYELRAGELESPARAERIVRPRQTAMWLCRTLTKASLPQIGRCFGGRDHTTVMHAVMTVDARRGVDAAFAADVDVLVAKIRGGRLLADPS